MDAANEGIPNIAGEAFEAQPEDADEAKDESEMEEPVVVLQTVGGVFALQVPQSIDHLIAFRRHW